MDSFAPAARPRSEDGVTHPPPHRTDDAADDSAAAFLQRIGSLRAGTLERAAMDAAPDGIVLADRQGRILMVNAPMETISGYTNAQLCGQSIDLLVPVHARPEHG